MHIKVFFVICYCLWQEPFFTFYLVRFHWIVESFILVKCFNSIHIYLVSFKYVYSQIIKCNVTLPTIDLYLNDKYCPFFFFFTFLLFKCWKILFQSANRVRGTHLLVKTHNNFLWCFLNWHSFVCMGTLSNTTYCPY